MKTPESCICSFEPTEEPFRLPENEGWPEQWHQFDEECVWAVQAALATGRPLLVRGEPGTGKSQLARAAAWKMNRPFLYEVVTNRTETNDLLWTFDAVARLAEAQVLGAGKADMDELRKMLAPERYIAPGRLWWAVNWPEAEKQAETSRTPTPPDQGNDWKNGCVLLVDEIDKADTELPNALLECFANQSFQVTHRADPVKGRSDQPSPLIVVTTNEERELPPAFVRRCLVLHLELEKDEEKLKEFLVQRGNVHFSQRFGETEFFEDTLKDAAEALVEDRGSARPGDIYKPGQAEYLDLCRAVFEIAATRNISSRDIMKKVKGYALKKNRK